MQHQRFTAWWKRGNNLGGWLDEAEKVLELEMEPGYDIPTLKDQIEENQEFANEVQRNEKRVERLFEEGEELAVSEDLEEADIDEVRERKRLLEQRWNNVTKHLWDRENRLETQLLQILKSKPNKWEEVFVWTGHRDFKFLTVLNTWQQFRKEQASMLDWLENKEKEIETIESVDISNKNKLDADLKKLKIIESELHEQASKLQSLHNTGGDITRDIDQESVAKNIDSQLQDFDNCYNDITKRVILRRQELHDAETKLKEFSLESNAVTNWIDRTEKAVKQYQREQQPNEIARLQQELGDKLKERHVFQTRVDRINALVQDLRSQLDENSYNMIKSELSPLNKRWSKSIEQLENLKQIREEHRRQDSGCCFVNIIRRKLRLWKS